MRTPQRAMFLAFGFCLGLACSDKVLLDRGNCDALLDCVGQLQPEAYAQYEAAYGPEGSCWDQSPDQFQACRDACDMAIDAYDEAAVLLGGQGCTPGGSEVSDETAGDGDPGDGDPGDGDPGDGDGDPGDGDGDPGCELDPTQPYGPPSNGSCPDYEGEPQLALDQPLGLAGSTCSPPCAGLANDCPDHDQTSAPGTCYVVVDTVNYCVLRCYVDPDLVGGEQCPCGAICAPHGEDGEGNMRGVCLWP